MQVLRWISGLVESFFMHFSVDDFPLMTRIFLLFSARLKVALLALIECRWAVSSSLFPF